MSITLRKIQIRRDSTDPARMAELRRRFRIDGGEWDEEAHPRSENGQFGSGGGGGSKSKEQRSKDRVDLIKRASDVGVSLKGVDFDKLASGDVPAKVFSSESYAKAWIKSGGNVPKKESPKREPTPRVSKTQRDIKEGRLTPGVLKAAIAAGKDYESASDEDESGDAARDIAEGVLLSHGYSSKDAKRLTESVADSVYEGMRKRR